jgi:hypothetical protein
VFEDADAFQEHVTKHGQQELQQSKMESQNNTNADTGEEVGPSLAKRAKIGNDEDTDNVRPAEGMAKR